MKKGLVIEGGGLRGAYSAGALTWLLDNEVKFDYGIGISASALYCFAYFSKNKELIRDIAIRIAGKPDAGLKALLTEGNVIAYNKMMKQLQDNEHPFDFETIHKIYDTDIESCVFNTTTGELNYFNNKTIRDDLLDLKAACTIPFFGKKVKIDDNYYFDGGLVHMIPIDRALEKKCDRILVITTKSKDYVRKEHSKAYYFAFDLLYGRIPNLTNYVRNRVSIYNKEKETINELVTEKKAIHMFPSKESGVGRFSGTTEQLELLFNIGYNDMEDNKEAIFELLKEE